MNTLKKPRPFISRNKILLTRLGQSLYSSPNKEFRNPFGTAMLVYELQFSILPFDTSTVLGLDSALPIPDSQAIVDPLQFVWIDVKAGNAPLTGQLTPLSIACESGDSTGTGSGPYYIPPGGDSVYRWRFKRPLLMPKDRVLTIRAYWDPMTGALPGQTAGGFSPPTEIPLSVTQFCKALPDDFETPSKIWLPYTTAWISPLAINDGSAYVQESGPADLSNPFSENLNVTDFCVSSLLTDTGILSGAVPPYQAFARIHKSNGEIVCKSPVPLEAIGNVHGSTRVNSVLRSNEFFRVTLEGTNNGQWTNAAVGMRGQREVAIGDIG